ncbi:hypothetical protein [Flavobacterium sp.]|uniref:hypothetical protein n=1 Tax=Flavobacterium sp. TaxID=239 RepID=UPI0037527231
MKFKQSTVGAIFITIIIVLGYFIYKDNEVKETSINNNKHITICKVYKINSRRSFTDACYYYKYNNESYESWESIHNSGNQYLNRYYKVWVSTENPEYSKIFLNQEITDSTEIVSAGFEYN